LDTGITECASATEELVVNILGTRFENFDSAVVEQAKIRIIDVIGCLLAGVKAPGNTALVELVRDWGGKEEATILVHGIKALCQNVAMVNCIMARSFDYEPNTAMVDGKIVPSHISGTTIITAMNTGEMAGVNGRELISALLAGEDMASRILAAASSEKRLDSIGTANVFGATAIAGRLIGLDKSQMMNAMGICLDHITGHYQNVWDRTYSFKLTQGLSARSGIFSAQLAKTGWTATKEPLLGKFGYYYLYFKDIDNIDILTKDLGKKYYTEAHFRPYPSCRYNHGPIECILSLTGKHQIETEKIKEVNVYVSRRSLQAAVSRDFNSEDSLYAYSLFSYRYAVANTLLRKGVRLEHLSEDSIRDAKIDSLIGKIHLAELPGSGLLESRVDVVMNDGSIFSEHIEAPKGDQEKNPMSRDEIIAKFWSNVEFSNTLKKKEAEKLLQLLNRLEELDSLDEVIRLLVVNQV
jgi:2-methylcitrate dehydratase PrpD